jgi:hypothetical protein
MKALFVLWLVVASSCVLQIQGRDVSVGDLLIPFLPSFCPFSPANTALSTDPRSVAAMPAGCKGMLSKQQMPDLP